MSLSFFHGMNCFSQCILRPIEANVSHMWYVLLLSWEEKLVAHLIAASTSELAKKAA